MRVALDPGPWRVRDAPAAIGRRIARQNDGTQTKIGAAQRTELRDQDVAGEGLAARVHREARARVALGPAETVVARYLPHREEVGVVGRERVPVAVSVLEVTLCDGSTRTELPNQRL